MSKVIFVFGSNLAGIHSKGAALMAKRFFGAQIGTGHGRTGNSYALPTKDINLHSLPLELIEKFVNEFIQHAKAHPGVIYQVTRIGCDLAGYSDPQIAPMFKDAPSNCAFSTKWYSYLPGKTFWGSF